MKLSILSLAIVVTLAFLGRHALTAEPAGAPPKSAAEQRARWILVYKVDEQKTVWRPDKMDSLVDAICRRINPDGQKEILVKGLGANLVQIDMPSVSGSTAKEKAAKAEEVRKLIRAVGALEFRIMATKRDNESMIEAAKAYRKKFPAIPKNAVRIHDPKTGKELGKWCRVRAQEVDKLKHDDAAMMVGQVKVTDQDGKEVDQDVLGCPGASPGERRLRCHRGRPP